ncbi:MAG: 50S ribosomal protein L21 [Bacteroidota bacterium]
MYAIVSIAGQQFKIEENKPVYVHRLDAKEGDSVTFDQVLMVGGNGSVKVGSPSVSGASISATVVSHMKGDKVLIFKKKRRKGYQKMNGHRQYLTKIKIDKISI